MSDLKPLTAAAVKSLFAGALFLDTEALDKPVLAEGVTLQVGFHSDRIEQARDQVRAWLRELPLEFFPKSMGGGDGWSFLQMPFKRNDVHWGEPPDCERLLQLAVALGEAKYLAPRSMWEVLPGGMPYVQFKA